MTHSVNGMAVLASIAYAIWMTRIIRIICVICCAGWLSGHASAEINISVDRQNATVCPAFETDVAPPSLSSQGCEDVSVWAVDPQGAHIWAIFTMTLDTAPKESPLGLMVSAKAASILYLNGELVGENGRPGDTKFTETLGQMDRIFPIRDDQFRVGENIIAIRMSSHSGMLHLRAPIHGVALVDYRAPEDAILRHYWLSFLPFGAFALGALYFTTMAVVGRQRLSSALIAGMSLVVAMQLLTEVSRGLTAYAYPVHDLRLIGIATFSALFGVLLASYVIWRLRPQNKYWLLGSVLAVTLAALIIPTGLDTKASFSLLAPTVLAALVALSSYANDKRNALMFGVSLLVFAAINLVGAGRFLDQYFYYAVAVLMLFLFSQQASAFARESTLRRREEARAEKLEFVLAGLREAAAETVLSVKSSGRLSRVAASDIAYISGAGDYTEIVTTTGDTLLHSATLTDLEETLPAFFLRVHRSYLVNTRLIASLKRNSAGTGELELLTEQSLPVSRRIMPKVKAALAS